MSVPLPGFATCNSYGMPPYVLKVYVLKMSYPIFLYITVSKNINFIWLNEKLAIT